MQVVLRAMNEADVPSVFALESELSAAPWTESIFSDCIKVGYSCWVWAEENTQDIYGYGLVSFNHDEAHILNLGVRPNVQRQGLGEKMMRHLIEVSKIAGMAKVFLEVRVSNIAGITLYQKLNFQEIGYRKDYYNSSEGYEDAYVFALNFEKNIPL